MGYPKRGPLQQVNLWSGPDHNSVRRDLSEIIRIEVSAYREHHLHLRKLARRFEMVPYTLRKPFTSVPMEA